MKKLLSLSSIRNKRCRESNSSLLHKTALHRYHYDADYIFTEWYYTLLDDAERKEVSEWLDYIPRKKTYLRRDAEQLKKYLKQLGVEVDIIGSIARDGSIVPHLLI